jgi:hypothetical protein
MDEKHPFRIAVESRDLDAVGTTLDAGVAGESGAAERRDVRRHRADLLPADR